MLFGSPFVPSDKEQVKRMVALTAPKSGETLYDLGSGDGRIVIEAAQKYGVKAIGIEINPVLVWLSNRKIQKLKLENKAKVYQGNFFKENLSKADIVMLYLWPPSLKMLERKLLSELKPGTRICSLFFPLKRIPLVKVDSKYSFIRLYQIPIKKPKVRSPNDEKGLMSQS